MLVAKWIKKPSPLSETIVFLKGIISVILKNFCRKELIVRELPQEIHKSVCISGLVVFLFLFEKKNKNHGFYFFLKRVFIGFFWFLCFFWFLLALKISSSDITPQTN